MDTPPPPTDPQTSCDSYPHDDTDVIDGPAEASVLVAACEHAWHAIQHHHPEVPDVVIILGTGVANGRLVKLGHWSTGRWTADGHTRGEVLLAGEGLRQPPADVFEVLLHEAAHGLNAARKIKDASRGGRYHNHRFKTAAKELGLTVATMPPYGYADTALTYVADARYSAEIAVLGDAMRIARNHTNRGRARDNQTGAAQTGTTKTGTGGLAMCGCGRRMRMAPTVLAQGPVTCGLCHQTFTTDPPSPTHPAAATLDTPTQTTGSASADATTESPTVPPRVNRLQDHAVAELARIERDPQRAEQLTRAAAWYGQRNADRPTALTGTKHELDALTRLARMMLTADRTLHEPTVTINGRDIAVGEHVVLARHHDTRDLDGRRLPPAGVFGIVERLDLDQREMRVDFAISGTHRIGLDTPIGRSLDHAYVELAPRTTARTAAARAATPVVVEAGFEPEP